MGGTACGLKVGAGMLQIYPTAIADVKEFQGSVLYRNLYKSFPPIKSGRGFLSLGCFGDRE
jgi:hypothetical protein